MRSPSLRLITVLLVIGVSAGACADRNDAAASRTSAPAPNSSPAARTPDDPCDGFVAWVLQYPGDRSQAAVSEYERMTQNPDGYSVRQRIALRQAFYGHHETLIRNLAGTADYPPVRKAFLSFADGLAAYASNATEAGPPNVMPDRDPIARACGFNSKIEIEPLPAGSPPE
ncbi:hypothetical protein [Paractinoplanes lichenicola]|uniref:Lipoprotein n=1 Tax=Paractinoplanes lichenicola TaxID=2802976 RepID=A0ABS1VVP0_9ACTN|nr:hypothetical protein [Actinoplanes lichenicola]MBL7258547.1 hypothetical protein [Actinoplanes lichenicola]